MNYFWDALGFIVRLYVAFAILIIAIMMLPFAALEVLFGRRRNEYFWPD